MGNKISAKVNFSNEFAGELFMEEGSVKIGAGSDRLGPYTLLLGALASCYYVTFLDIAKKKRAEFSHVEIQLDGEKRDEIPATLKQASLKIKVYGGQDEKALLRSFELASQYCSVYQTLAFAAEMSYTVEFA
ncbi:MAG: OsmC family protein [Clostridia bacterium]